MIHKGLNDYNQTHLSLGCLYFLDLPMIKPNTKIKTRLHEITKGNHHLCFLFSNLTCLTTSVFVLDDEETLSIVGSSLIVDKA